MAEGAPAETILVISDTHLERCSPGLLTQLARHGEGCRRLVHAGDITTASVIEALSRRFEVVAVRGNMDPVFQGTELPQRLVIDVGGVQVGIQHGEGGPEAMELRLLTAFAPQPPPVIVYGHTHRASDRTVQGVRLVNPGSPTDRRWAPFRSLGLLAVSGGEVSFSIVPLD
jgi:uncharacterized protein